MLATEVLGSERAHPGPAVALLHGFTQTRRSWGPVADGLAASRRVVLVWMFPATADRATSG